MVKKTTSLEAFYCAKIFGIICTKTFFNTYINAFSANCVGNTCTGNNLRKFRDLFLIFPEMVKFREKYKIFLKFSHDFSQCDYKTILILDKRGISIAKVMFANVSNTIITGPLVF